MLSEFNKLAASVKSKDSPKEPSISDFSHREESMGGPSAMSKAARHRALKEEDRCELRRGGGTQRTSLAHL